MKHFPFILLLFFGLNSRAQEQNYAVIPAGTSEENIIKLAANITPSPRQLKWQKLEMTAFFHFGVNTYTNPPFGARLQVVVR